MMPRGFWGCGVTAMHHPACLSQGRKTKFIFYDLRRRQAEVLAFAFACAPWLCGTPPRLPCVCTVVPTRMEGPPQPTQAVAEWHRGMLEVKESFRTQNWAPQFRTLPKYYIFFLRESF